MNDQVLPKSNGAPKIDQVRKLALFGWTLRVLTLATIVVGGIAIVFHYYREAAGVTVPTPEVESVKIVEASDADADIEIPLTSITSCIDQQMIDESEHPLSPLIVMAEQGQDIIQSNVSDYTATLTKRIRVKGKLLPEEKLFIKIRHEKTDEDGNATPFSVYTRFIDPKKGQEAIWVDGRNDNKLVAHGPVGILNIMTLNLDPEGKMALNGNRYPIWSAGMLNLIKLLIEKAEHDIQYDDCKVELTRNVMLGDANCTRFVIMHEKPQDYFEYHRVEVYIDDDRNLPIGFRSYSWPDSKGGKPRLEERYYYTDIKLNVGLTDSDFDPANAEYDFPGN